MEGWLALHFGMSGGLVVYTDTRDMPRHTRILPLLTNNALAYTSQRKLGRIEWTPDPAEFIKAKKL